MCNELPSPLLACALTRRRVLIGDQAASDALRPRRGTRTPQNSAIFLFPDLPPNAVAGHPAVLCLPILYKPIFNGMEPVQHLALNAGDMIAIQWVAARIDLHTCSAHARLGLTHAHIRSIAPTVPCSPESQLPHR